ncbi:MULTISPECIES: c-type cytochrome [Corallincola]|uniref:Cytochrome c4 n=3 Tax=Corallincola TaxID=1775176 RepID=A0A368N4N7_9GAMM|nr:MULTISPECIES: c-type cytochrome [Corallincola]RCU45186.1 cytochrome c4 [Corallincola holothuriorum]TAA46764.1 cytochrome c4 [Corallincola spongiicola]TCI04409.1 cytochrome c4 [Corallincola luteus]
MKRFLIVFTALVGSISAAYAEGDIEAGKAAAATCAACHGVDGNSTVAIYPKLAGQHASYLEKQLHEFKLGMQSAGKEGRYDPVMSGMAMPLDDAAIANLSAYFASLTATPGATPEDVVEVGHQLFRGGDPERGLPACLACHGPRGVGSSLAKFPAISGQHPDYTKAQLEKFRSGDRANDMNAMMRDVAMKLTDEEIEILSKYLAGLH